MKNEKIKIFIVLVFLLPTSLLEGSDLEVSELLEHKNETFNSDCASQLQRFDVHLDRMLPQVERILDKVQITPINKEFVRKMKDLIKRKKNNYQNFEIKTLLHIAHFLDVTPSTLLSSKDLESHVKLENLRSRSYLSPENIRILLKLINQHLKDYVRELQHEFAFDEGLESNKMNSSQLTKFMSVPPNTLSSIMARNVVPNYRQLKQVLDVGIDIIDFFKEVESLADFHTYFQANTHSAEPVLTNQKKKRVLISISRNMIRAMNLRGIESNTIKHIFQSGEKNIQFRSIFKVSYITRYSVSDIINGTELQNKNSLPDIRIGEDTHKDRDIYISKAKQILAYLIKTEMQFQNLSIQQLSENSGVHAATIQNFFETNGSIEYFNLYKIVTYGLDILLADFFGHQNSTGFTFEELIEQFDTINFNVPVISQDITINNYLEHLRNRTSVLLNILTSHFSERKIKTLTGLFINRFQEDKMTIRTLLRLAHIFDLTLSQLLGHEDISSLQPVNLEKLPDVAVQNALHVLSQNIQREMQALNISLLDLQFRMNSPNIRLRYLEPILNGHINANYHRLAYVCKGLLQLEEDIFTPMQRLLEGV